MAATGYTPIYLYYSSTTSNTPSAGNLGYGELAINIADKNLFFKDNTNAVNTVPIRQANGSSNGWLSSTDWTTFNNKGSGTVTSVSALTLGTTGTDLSSTVANGTTTPVITLNVPTASASNRGALSSTDWSTFNGKQAALVSGTNIKTVSGTTLLGSGDLGTIGTGYGGTGLTSFTSGGVLYASSTSALATGSALQFNGTNLSVGYIPTTTLEKLNINTSSGGGIGFNTNATYTNWQTAKIAAVDLGASYRGALAFYTNPGPNATTTTVEAMRIWDSSGVSIGNTTDPGAQNLFVNKRIYANTNLNQGSGTVSIYPDASGTTCINTQYSSTAYYVGLWYTSTSTLAGYIYANGSATTYATASDYRLKENVKPMQGALNKVMQLKPVTYNWKVDGTSSQGFIAHELQSVVPECVVGKKDDVSEDGSIKPQGVDTSFLVATLTKAIQEQQEIINNLKLRLETLENK